MEETDNNSIVSKHTKMPSVIAVVPSYNAGNHLVPCLKSLLKQTYQNYHIIVVDDASTDNSFANLGSIDGNNKITIRRNTKNLGKALSLNRVFEETNADFFVLQDADDTCEPNRIEKQVQFMMSNPLLGCSSSYINYINIDNVQIGRGTLDLHNPSKLKDYLCSNEPFGLFCPAVILKSEVVKNPDLRFRSRFWPADDIDLWNRIAEAGWIVLAQPEYLVNYRIHSNSAVASSFRKTREKYEYVRACLRSRRAEQNEPSWTDFIEDRRNRSSLNKINDWRKTTAKLLYRQAGFYRGMGRYIPTILSLVGAICLQPTYVFKRLWKQLA